MNKKTLLNWLLTPFFLLIFLFNLCLFEVLFRLRGLFPGQVGYEVLFRGINRGVLLCLKLATGLRYQVIGELKQWDSPVLIISNHQSMFDIPFLCLALPNLRLRFVAKEQLARKIPGISVALRNGEHAIIDRKNPRQAMPELERSARLSKERGYCLTVFPEGTRSRDGHLKPFKAGGISKIIESLGEVTILPIAIRGSSKIALHSLWPVVVGQKVEVCITKSFKVRAGEDIALCLEKARGQIQEALNLEGPSQI